MIFVNDILVTEEKNITLAKQILKKYLSTERLVLLGKENELLIEEELNDILENIPYTINLKAVSSFQILRDFKAELHNYIIKVEEYINFTRETEDFSTTMNSFVHVSEALIEFDTVANFLQKNLIDQQQIQAISQKALNQAEAGNAEYILDLLEYELLPILHNFINETNEEM